MRRTFSLMVCLIALVSVPALAQQSPRAATAAPTPPVAQGGARAATPAPVDPRFDISDVNIGITVTITDKSPGGNQTKTVSLMFANRSSGRVRSSGSTQTANTSRGSELNVDANATLMKSGTIYTQFTINYQPEWTDETTKMTGVSQSVNLYLKDGAATVITQAADPTKGTRSVAVEVTAKVIR